MTHGSRQLIVLARCRSNVARICRSGSNPSDPRWTILANSHAVPPRSRSRHLLGILTLILLYSGTTASLAASDEIDFSTGSSFRSALEQAFSAAWEQDSLRGIVHGVETAKRVSIVLDRRLDPTAIRSLRISGETLREGLDRLAAETDAAAVVIGNSVYLGPRATSSKLRTLLALRIQDLSDRNAKISDRRRTELTRARTIRWNDFDRPADLVRRLASEYSLALSGIELLPHDLWAGATLPDAGPAEALTLILAQFDLTFVWTEQGRGISIEPMPERVAIDRSYDPPAGLSAAATISRWKEELPDLEAREERGKIVVSGTEELHEVVKRVRRGGRAAEKTSSRTAQGSVPLKLRKYSLEIQRKPASAVLNALSTPEYGDITFEFSRTDFKAAGIDLDQLVTFEVRNVTIEKLLQATLEPLGVAFEIHDRTVRLTPAPRRDP
jgi:hypothetical protein